MAKAADFETCIETFIMVQAPHTLNPPLPTMQQSGIFHWTLPTSSATEDIVELITYKFEYTTLLLEFCVCHHCLMK